ncbi:protein Wnt [Elysia marginata]|uniref:Protein Wnt n=1 Tax=Elysia marginata TaxID=1093978 RepID=A0AAV4I0A5_9GAST|nr:protein Wnt [Elysia marginata]
MDADGWPVKRTTLQTKRLKPRKTLGFTTQDVTVIELGKPRYLGVASSYQILADEVRYMPDSLCEELPYLQPHQRDICGDDARLLDVIREGAAMGIQECQHQFQDRRWNCSTFNNDTSVFGPVLHTSTSLMKILDSYERPDQDLVVG